MTWFKVDDKMATHPKFVACDLAARGLWVTMGCWSSDHLTDGLIPHAAAALFDRDGDATAQLVLSGLWLEVDGGYQFHDWHEYQPTAKAAKAKKKARAKAGSKGAAKRWQTDSKHDGKPMRLPCPEPEPEPEPEPVDPPCGPPEGDNHATKRKPKKRAGPIPPDFVPSDADRAMAAEMGLDIRSEIAELRDWTTAKGQTYVDWNAALRSQMRRKDKRAVVVGPAATPCRPAFASVSRLRPSGGS